MKQTAVCLAFLLTSLTLVAQNSAETNSPVLVLKGTPVGSSCPIGMHASHGVWDHTIWVRHGHQEQTPPRFGQRILLSLTDAHPAPLVAATVRVIGTTGRNRMLQTKAGNPEADGVRTVNVRFTREQDNAVSGDLFVPGLTSVSSVELQEVSYSDGKIWRIGGSRACRVTPDPLMLVATH